MTGYQSKKAASLDEEGFYTIHPKDEDDDIQVYQRPWVGLTEQELESAYWGYMEVPTQNGFEKTVKALEAKLKEKNT
jgi:hypothetical protein